MVDTSMGDPARMLALENPRTHQAVCSIRPPASGRRETISSNAPFPAPSPLNVAGGSAVSRTVPLMGRPLGLLRQAPPRSSQIDRRHRLMEPRGSFRERVVFRENRKRVEYMRRTRECRSRRTISDDCTRFQGISNTKTARPLLRWIAADDGLRDALGFGRAAALTAVRAGS